MMRRILLLFSVKRKYLQMDKMTIDVIQNGKRVSIIRRNPIVKGFFGNFIPHWARYQKKVYLIHGGIDYAYMHGPKPEGRDYYIDISQEVTV